MDTYYGKSLGTLMHTSYNNILQTMYNLNLISSDLGWHALGAVQSHIDYERMKVTQLEPHEYYYVP